MHIFQEAVFWGKQHGRVYCGFDPNSQWERSMRKLIYVKFVRPEAAAPPVEPVKIDQWEAQEPSGVIWRHISRSSDYIMYFYLWTVAAAGK